MVHQHTQVEEQVYLSQHVNQMELSGAESIPLLMDSRVPACTRCE